MSCLFNSLSYHHPGISSSRMRHMICDFLSSNPPLIDNIRAGEWISWAGSDLKEYTRIMRSPNTWGGAIEIRAYCLIFRRSLHVHVVKNGRVVEFLLTKDSPVTRVVWSGNHFEPKR